MGPSESKQTWLVVSRRLRIPLSEFEFEYVRASGPGGQNVNKVASKARMRWPIATSPSLSEPIRQRFVEKFGGQIASSGELIITGQRYRDQGRNATDCLEKLKAMLQAVEKPAPIRKKTKPSRASKARRLTAKRQKGEKKESRRRPRYDE